MDNTSNVLTIIMKHKYFYCTVLFPHPFSLFSVGYKSKVDSSITGANKKIIMEAIARKIEEYHNRMDLVEIRKMYETHKVIAHSKLPARIILAKASTIDKPVVASTDARQFIIILKPVKLCNKLSAFLRKSLMSKHTLDAHLYLYWEKIFSFLFLLFIIFSDVIYSSLYYSYNHTFIISDAS